MNKTIGFDCDDCIIDSFPKIHEVALKEFGINFQNVSRFNLLNQFDISREDLDHVITKALRHCWEELNPVDGVVDFINEYVGHNDMINVVTYRGEYARAETFMWFNKWFPNVSYKVHFIDKQKLKSTAVKDLKIDYFIEDRVTYAIDVSTVCEKVFLMAKPWNNRELNHSNIVRVNGYSDIKKLLNGGLAHQK